MATEKQRAARRRQRLRKKGRVAMLVPLQAKQKRPRSGRKAHGILSDLGNSILGDTGARLGNFAESAIIDLVNRVLGSKGGSAPIAFAGRALSAQVNTSVIHGVEQLDTIRVSEGTPAGTILRRGLIAAPDIGVRLANLAQLWARCTFKQFIIVVTSSNPTTVDGNYTIGVDPDPTTRYVSGEELPARLMSLVHASKANAWADNAIAAGLSGAKLFNRFNAPSADEAEVRQYADGQYIIATTTDYKTDCTYTVNVIWSVLLEQPNTDSSVNPEPVAPYYAIRFPQVVSAEIQASKTGLALPVDTLDWVDDIPDVTEGTDGQALTASCNLSNGTNNDFAVPLNGWRVSLDSATKRKKLILSFARTTSLAAGPCIMGEIIPNPLRLPNFGVAPVRSTKFVPAGFGKFHSWFPIAQEIDWYNKSRRKQRQNMEQKAAHDVLLEQLRDDMRSLSLTQLAEKAGLREGSFLTPALSVMSVSGESAIPR